MAAHQYTTLAVPHGPCLVPLFPNHDQGLAQRLFAKTLKTAGCWEWQGGKGAGGYGRFSIHGKGRRTHRTSWVLHYGPIPDELFVLHKCDNKPCVRPDHLFLGTHQDNIRDCWAKGRAWFCLHPEKRPRGERASTATLLPQQVVEIFTLWNLGTHNGKQIAEMYHVSPRAIYGITRGRTWRHVLDALPGGGVARAATPAQKQGERHWAAKLTEEDVQTIRQRFHAGQGKQGMGSVLAQEFGVTPQNIYLIVKRKRWIHLSAEENL